MWPDTKLAYNKAAGLRNKMEALFLQHGGSRWFAAGVTENLWCCQAPRGAQQKQDVCCSVPVL